MKKALSFPMVAASALFIGYSTIIKNSPAQNLFGINKDKNKSQQVNREQHVPTKTYIWGNGVYQPRPDAPMRFTNLEPKLIKSFLGPKNLNFKQITFGEYHEGGIDLNGNAYVWKKYALDASVKNESDDNYRSNLIKLEEGHNSKYLTFSKGYIWGLKEDGNVYQWKVINEFDEDNNVINTNVNDKPRKIDTLKDIIQISCGEDHFVALDKNGEVWIMGDDTLGQCGLGAQQRGTAPPFFPRRIRAPTKIPTLQNIRKIVAGGNHTLAINDEGLVYGWGSNSTLQLSHEEEFSVVDQPLIAVYQPLRINKNIGSNYVSDIAAGNEFSIFVTRNKHNGETEVFGCGYNVHGELGCGNLNHIQDVKKLESLSNYKIDGPGGEQKDVTVKQLECGDNHCIALLSVGAVLEWGANEFGQLGNKKRVFCENPIIVSDFVNDNVIKVNAKGTNSSVICEYNEKEEEERRKAAEEKKAKKEAKKENIKK